MTAVVKKTVQGGILGVALACSMAMVPVHGQQNPETKTKPVVSDYTLACAGYVSSDPVSNDIRIVGAERESTTSIFAQGDTVYLNVGRSGNLQVGAEYKVIRNVGQLKDIDSRSKALGTLIREVGIIRITALQDNSASAEVRIACQDIFLGDSIVPYDRKSAPPARSYKPLSVAAAPTGRGTGKIFAARENREQLAQNDIVYINVGADNGLKVGDYMTVYRTLGSDSVTKFRDDQIGPRRSGGFVTDRFKSRNNVSLTNGGGKGIPKAVEGVPRNTLPRAVVGELVILRTEANTAVAVVTRTVKEAFIGDYVEQQN